jgi:hypothetical protein
MDSAYYIPVPLARTPLEKDEGRQRGEGKLTQVGSANQVEVNVTPTPKTANTSESVVVDSIYQPENGFNEKDIETERAAEELPTKEQESVESKEIISSELFKSIAQKVANEEKGTPEEIQLFKTHEEEIMKIIEAMFAAKAGASETKEQPAILLGQSTKTFNKDAFLGNVGEFIPFKEQRAERVLSAAEMGSEEILKKYMMFSDTIEDQKLINEEYLKTHYPDGVIRKETQRAIDTIKNILEQGKEEIFEQTTSKIILNNKAVLEKLGINPSLYAMSRTSGYGGIVERVYRAAHPDTPKPYEGETIADPLDWENGGDSFKVLQDAADQLIGEEIVHTKTTRETITGLISKKRNPNVTRIKDLLKRAEEDQVNKGKNGYFKQIGKPQLAELGRLVRKVQGIDGMVETKKLGKVKFTPLS